MKAINRAKVAILTLIITGFVSIFAFADDMQAPMMHSDEKMSKMNDGMKNKMEGEMKMDMRSGMLAGTEGHHAAGKVTFTQEMGKDLLHFSDIEVDKVPDGHVYLAKNSDRAQGIDLGILKQFSGDVTFILPVGTDLAAYDTVIIHCEEFNVEIGRAVLHAKMWGEPMKQSLIFWSVLLCITAVPVLRVAAEKSAQATFVVAWYDVGFAALDGRSGVVSVEKGWHGLKEVNRVVYNPADITVKEMQDLLRKAGTYISTVKE